MLKLTSVNLQKITINTLAIPVCEDGMIHEDPVLIDLINKAKAHPEFKAEPGDVLTLYDLPEVKPNRVVFLGIGKQAKVDTEGLRAFAGKAVKKALKDKLERLLLAAPSGKTLKIEAADVLEALLEGAYLANYLFDAYKAEKKIKPLKQVQVWTDAVLVRRLSRLATKVETICAGTQMARELVNTPSNDKRPEQLARTLAASGRKAGLKVTVLNDSVLKKQGFGALLAVAAGSQSKPRLVVLEYIPKNHKKTIALVGKGVTFDSGGINLKPTPGLKDMKIDMAGAAAVAAALIATAGLKPPMRVVGLIPIVENMVSGDATRPGDIVKSYAGKTVEIGNTDAEGRLILIDAMAYANKKFKPHTMIDLATLTGACMVALGDKIAGVFSQDRELSDAIVAAGEKAYERCWPMPLPPDYKETLKSDVADISNMSSSKYGGAVTAALFLSEFVGETRWAHIDIAGPVYASKEGDYCPPGATGFGVRLLCNLLETLE
jgi:leucyl aminopeptidase